MRGSLRGGGWGGAVSLPCEFDRGGGFEGFWLIWKGGGSVLV